MKKTRKEIDFVKCISANYFIPSSKKVMVKVKDVEPYIGDITDEELGTVEVSDSPNPQSYVAPIKFTINVRNHMDERNGKDFTIDSFSIIECSFIG